MVRNHPFWLQFPSCLHHMRHVLLQDVIFAKSEGTVRSYLYKCRQFLTWVKSQGLPASLPFSVEVISVYLHQSKLHVTSDSPLITSVAALKWLHSLVNPQSNPLDSPMVQNILISCRRQTHRPPTHKQPISLSQVRDITTLMTGPDSSLADIRTACYVSLKYALLFRHTEMAELKASHFTPLPDKSGFSIFVPKSKTDIFRDGSTVILADSTGDFSPVSILLKFLSMSGISIGQDLFLFTPITFHQRTQSYSRADNRPLSYSRCRELFHDALRRIGEDPHSFGLHSLRAGGASHLANKHIPEEQIMHHVRWKTTIAKNRYIQ